LASELDLSSSIDGSSLPSRRDIVTAVIDAQFNQLRTSICVLVARSGLAEGAAEIGELADEILQTTAEDALRGAETYDPSRSAHAWLLGIAAHKITDKQRSKAKDHDRTLSIEAGVPQRTSSIQPASDPESQSPEDRLDAALYHSSLRDRLIDHDPFMDELLSLVNTEDRRVLTLVYVDGLDGVRLAAVLGIREGAAYVRAARAREHLRQKYLAAEGRIRKDH
jgi:RNA polymerase sigma factor (sigma-70 family)